MYDGQFQALDIGVNHDEESLELVIVKGSAMQTPQGLMPLMTGIERFPMNRKSALGLAESLTEAAESLPEEKPQSDLVVAQSLSGVDQAAKQQEAIKKGNRPKR